MEGDHVHFLVQGVPNFADETDSDYNQEHHGKTDIREFPEDNA